MSKPGYAFRCRNCGRLVSSEDAGERDFPAACPICGHGIEFDTLTGNKTYVEDNWIVLANLSDEELEAERVRHTDAGDFEYWAKDEIKIQKHKAAPSTIPEGREPQNIEATVEDALGAEDHT